MSSITFTPAMRFSSIDTAIVRGTNVEIFSIDTALSPGFPKFIISAKADAQFLQAPFRIKTVFATVGLSYPKGKIITNIVHSAQKLQSQECDFALAVSLLVAQDSQQVKIQDCAFIGTLSLDGSVIATRGTLAILAALRYQKKYVFVSSTLSNHLLQYSLWKDMRIIPVDSIVEVWNYINSQVDLVFYALNRSDGMNSAELSQNSALQKVDSDFAAGKYPLTSVSSDSSEGTELADSYSDHLSIWGSNFGHAEAKQQLLFSAVGAHHVFIYGPCGVGKTQLAQDIIHIYPEIDEEERLQRDIFRVISPENTLYPHFLTGNQMTVCGKCGARPELIKPVGKLSHSQVFGGKYPNFEPGYVHLASQGILFFDECTFIASSVLEAMRVFLDEQKNISPAYKSLPKIDFQLIMAANMCACGSAYPRQCLCTVAEKRKYRARISYALLDRIDIHIPMFPLYPSPENISSQKTSNSLSIQSSHQSSLSKLSRLREMVTQARERSYDRWKMRIPNARITDKILREHTILSLADQDFLHQLIRDYKFSARAYTRILSLAWSIADFSETASLTSEHIKMACELKEPW